MRDAFAGPMQVTVGHHLGTIQSSGTIQIQEVLHCCLQDIEILVSNFYHHEISASLLISVTGTLFPIYFFCFLPKVVRSTPGSNASNTGDDYNDRIGIVGVLMLQ